MKAAVCTNFNAPLDFQTLKIGAPKGHEVKIRIDVVAICHSDISFMKGFWGGTLPAIYGHEAAGTVMQTGDHVKNFKSGQKVIVTLMRSCGTCSFCANQNEALCETPPDLSPNAVAKTDADMPILSAMYTGAFAEEIIVHERQIVALPDDISMESGALIGCGVITGYGSVRNVAKVIAGESVAVVGCGGVGVNALQAARVSGASIITAIDAADSKEAICRRVGATDFINPLNDPSYEDARAITNANGYDVVLVAVGSAKVITSSLDLLRPGGRLVVMGMPPSGDMAEIEMTNLAAKGQSILGTKMGSSVISKDIGEIISLYRDGHWILDELISERFDFEDINDAITAAESPDSFRIVVRMQQKDS